VWKCKNCKVCVKDHLLLSKGLPVTDRRVNYSERIKRYHQGGSSKVRTKLASKSQESH
jgi:hypothetical protein